MAIEGDEAPRRIGLAQIVFFVIAAAAPLTGTLGAIPIAIGLGSGAKAPLAFLAAGILLLLFSVGYAKMSRHVTEAGAFYAYIAKGLGAPLGVGASWIAVLSYTAMQLALFGLFGFFCTVILPSFLPVALPWWCYSCGALLVSFWLGQRNVDVNASILGVLMILEIGIVLALVVAILGQAPAAQVTLDGFVPSPGGQAGFGIAAMFALSCFVGFEATAIYTSEARDPERTVPRATYVSVLVITLFYGLACWAIVCAYGPLRVQAAALRDPGAFWFSVAQARIGPGFSSAMQILLLTSIFASLLAFHNALARYLSAMAGDRLIFRGLGALHPRHRSPYRASQAQSLVAFAALILAAAFGIDPYGVLFGWGGALGTTGILMLQILVGISVLRFFGSGRNGKAGPLVLGAAALSSIGLAALLVVMIDNLPILAGGGSRVLFILPVLQFAILFGGTLYGARLPGRGAYA